MHERVNEIGSSEAGNDLAVSSASAVVTGLLPINEEKLDEFKERIDRTLAEAKKELQKEIFSFAELMTREFPPARYVIEPFFEVGAVNMLSAPPNNWKSWFLFYFASCIASGSLVFNKFQTEKSGVLIVNEEDSHRAVQDRFNLLKVTDQTLPIFFKIASGAKLSKSFIEEIISECEIRNIRVVMFDSLRSMHEAEENDSTAMQVVMDHLKTLAREGLTIIFTHHNRKKSMFGKGDEAEASRGSSAINAAVSGYLSLEEEERESGKFVIVRHLKSKVGEKLDPFEIKILKDSDGKGIKFNYEGEFKSGERKLTQAKGAILFAAKAGEWKTVSDFINLDIAGKGIVRAALTALVMEGGLVCLTRGEAREKGYVPITGGHTKEKLYSLPSNEEMEQNDEADEIFDSI